MAGVSLSNKDTRMADDAIRPVNLQTDLGQLADLIEAAFSGSMDSGGRSAIREMRQLSRLGFGLSMISGLNELAQGMSLGYVWVADGRVVGNVSVYPADYPASMGKVWIIANVAVYPEYRGQGIASKLMAASLNMIRQRSGGGAAVLQVDKDNEVARHLYRRLGFTEERVFSQWRRARYLPVESLAYRTPPGESFRVVGRRLGDSDRELALAQQVRPQAQGGLDWLRPTHIQMFRLSPWRRLTNWLNLRSIQRLVVRDPDSQRLRAWLQIERSFGVSGYQLLLMSVPEQRQAHVDALIRLAVRRFGGDGLSISHPADDDSTAQVLRRYQFTLRRTVVHMRCKM